MISSLVDNCAAVIEKTPEKQGLYTSDKDQIVCVNHFQSDIFLNDAKNRECIRESDSPYRLERVNELLDTGVVFDENAVASILRNTHGLGGKKIGYGNEKAINQLITHHAVIFKPDEQKFWVSTHPYQLGELAAYNADSIFAVSAESLRRSGCLPEIAGSIPADSFLSSNDYQQFLLYRQMRDSLKTDMKSKKNGQVDESFVNRFLQTNPEFYQLYSLLGDWYESKKNYAMAVTYWKTALTKEIPRLQEKEYLEKQMRKYKKYMSKYEY
jgi:hypothetical protein